MVRRGGLTEPVCLILASRSVPMGGGTFRSCCEELPGLGWGGGATAEVERVEDDTVEGGGTGDSPGRKETVQEEKS